MYQRGRAGVCGLYHRRTCLEWVSRFNRHRLHELIGYISLAEAEVNYYQQLAEKIAVASNLNQAASMKPRAIHYAFLSRLMTHILTSNHPAQQVCPNRIFMDPDVTIPAKMIIAKIDKE